MKPLQILVFSILVSGLSVTSSTADKEPADICDILTHPSNWSETEKRVWHQICEGEIADLNSDGILNLTLPCSRNPDRIISGDFLKTILIKKYFREAITQRGVRITGACFADEIDLENEYFPWPMELKGSRFEQGLNMSSLKADRSVLLENSFITGAPEDNNQAINLRRAVIGGFLSLMNSRVEGILDITASSIGGSMFLRGHNAIFNEIRLTGAKIERQLSMVDARVNGKLGMNSIKVGSHLLMYKRRSVHGTAFFKEVTLREGQIGGQVSLNGATFGHELDMSSVSIGSNLYMGKNANFGVVNLRFATVGLSFNIEGGTFCELNLRGATVKRELISSFTSWPHKLEVEGFKYRQFGEGELGAKTRFGQSLDDLLEWLERDQTFSFQPYTQLAAVLRNAGRSFAADKVLFTGKEIEREHSKGLEYAWLTILRYGIGYGIGIYIFHVLVVAFVVTMLGWFVLCRSCEDRKHQDTTGRLGFWFSLDYLLPGIRLRQAHFENLELSYPVRVYFYVHQIVGYVLVFFVIAGLTGMTQ